MNPSPLNIRITQKADADEASIYQYIERTFGKVYADRFRVRLIELFHKLAIMPTAGRTAKAEPSIRIFIFNRQNKVVYKITEQDLVIIRILNTKARTTGNY